jgi:hypothetical protein
MAAQDTVDLLRPDSDTHGRLLEHFKERIRFSEERMRKFHSRWTANERRVQAYIQLSDYEQLLKDQSDAKGQPQLVNIVIPHTYATLATAVTYWLHTFTGRVPHFPVRSNQGERVNAAQTMEIVLQYNADHSRFVKQVYQFLNDCGLYGVGILRPEFKTIKRMRTVIKPGSPNVGLAALTPETEYKARELRTVYQGSEIGTIDPYMFLPDPRVPMVEVNKRGEWVAWRSYNGRHELKRGASEGIYVHVDAIPKTLPRREVSDGLSSARSAISGGDPFPGAEEGRLREPGMGNIGDYIQVDEGTFELIPSEFGLAGLVGDTGSPNAPRKFLVTVANLGQIIRLTPFDHDHDMHPVCVAEPHTMGYGFGQPSMTDYGAPFQDLLGWLFNSHMENVRNAVSNMLVVDPSRVEMQDLKRKPTGGRLIRLKKSAYGTDVGQAVSQLSVMDVTRGHLGDMDIVTRLADSLSGVGDNLRAIQSGGGRKSATEVRVSADSGASRLAATAKLISGQGMVDLAQQMSLDNQQFLEHEFAIQSIGDRWLSSPIMVKPGDIAGDFYFPIHDGTLPVDKTAMFDLWRELFGIILQDMQLRTVYDVPRIFDFVAELGGAYNVEGFKIQVVPDQVATALGQSGNAVPTGAMPGAMPGMPPQGMGSQLMGQSVPAEPRRRLNGGAGA